MTETTPHPLAGQEILFTRQRHEAVKAGLHWDYRLVLGDKAYSWATKKELPEPGSAIILFEQPVHDKTYALSERVEIPAGSYGHGVTTLDWVRKAKVDPETEEGKLVIHSGGERFLLKKLDAGKYGEKSWLFKNLSGVEKKATLASDLHARFQPDFTPEEMKRLGVLRHPGSAYNPEDENAPDKNFFGVSASLKTWPEKWFHESHPLGWFSWFEGYSKGVRGPDDERQIKRWISFRARHMAQLQKADPTLENDSIHTKRRQALLNWSVAVGDKNRYLARIRDGLEKEAKQAESKKKVGNDERPHVEAAHKRLEENKGLIVHWGTGSGKTRFFLEAAKRALDKDKVNDALIVAPASLVTNVDKELLKHKIKLDRKRLQVMSYERANNISDQLSKGKYSIAIADEAQKLRNPGTQRSKSLSEVFANADKRLLATATANYNSAADIAPLINIATGRNSLPLDKAKFESLFLKDEAQPQTLLQRIRRDPVQTKQKIVNKGYLAKLFEKHVHYYDPADDPASKDKFPTVSEKTIEVEMDAKQAKMYKFVEGRIPFLLRMKIRHNLPLDKKEKANLNSFSQGVRQVSNSHRSYHADPDSVDYTPKIKTAVSNLEKAMKGDKNFKGLVYSNYLDSGVYEYSNLLKEKGIKHGIFTGALSKAEKDKLKDDYNSGKIPVLLVSSSGSEGLDLKGTKLGQVLEPHFNKAKIKQVIGRTARYESHAHLPPEERKVQIEHYHSVHPPAVFGGATLTIDQYMHQNGEDKQEVFEQIKDIMKRTSAAKTEEVAAK